MNVVSMRKLWPIALLGFAVLVLALPGATPAWGLTPTTTTVACTPNPLTAGQFTDCTATVNGALGSTNGDAFNFTQAGGSGSIAATSCILSGGSPSCTASVTATGAGSPVVNATFNPIAETTNKGSWITITLTVAKATPTLTLYCSVSSVVVGYSTICTLRVTGGAPVDGTIVTFTSQAVTGAVAFPNGAFCTIASAMCSLKVTGTAAGSVTLQATYPPDANDNGPLLTTTTLTITKAASSTTVVCTPSTVLVGQQSTCKATITGYSPTGQVSWSSSDTGGVFSQNPCTLSLGSCNVTYTAKSSATITATYAGDGNNTGSQGQFSIAANVNEQIQITVANSGPVANVLLSGCSVAPTVVPADGTPYTFTATSGCSGITVTLPPATSVSQYLTAKGQTALTIGACSSSSCALFSATIYYQLLNTYQVAPASPSSWSTAGTITVSGTNLGVSGTPVCTIPVTSGTGIFSCQGWSDYGTQVTVGPLQASGTQRWATGEGSFTDTQGGNQHTSHYYSQVLEDFQYTLVGSTTAPTAPTLTYTEFGGQGTLPLTGSDSLVWLDTGSSWSVPATLSGSTGSERWQCSLTSGAATAGQTVPLKYYHQYLLLFNYSVVAGGTSYIPPSVTFTSFGSPQQGTQGWVDAGSAFNFTNPLAGSTTSERWYSANSVRLASAAGTIDQVYYHQYALAMNFTVVGGGTFLNPRLNFTSLGTPALAQLNQTRGVVWVDAGASWNVGTLLPNSSPTERWVTKQAASGVASAPVLAGLRYWHQYLESLRYSISGSGGSPPVPTVNYSSLGTSFVAPLNTSAHSFWMDAGSSWVTPPAMPGAQGERWLSNITFPMQTFSAFHNDVQYSHQFYLAVGVSNPAGGQVANADQWKDQGSSVILNATASKLWSFSYWRGDTPSSYNGTERLASFTISGPANETAIFYPGLFISTNDMGAVQYIYGTINGTVPAGSNSTIYPPPGRSVTLIAMPKTVTTMFSGWAGALTDTQLESSLAIHVPSQLHATFQTDYNDIRTFMITSIVVFGAACFVFIVRRGYIPKLGRS